MDHARYQQIRQRVLKTPRNPWLTAPNVEIPDSPDGKNLDRITAETRSVVDALVAEKARLEASDDYTDEGRDKRLRAFYDEKVKPTLENARKLALPEFRKRAQFDLQKANVGAYDLPQDPYQVALAMEGLRVVREGKAARKLSIVDLERLPFSTRQAIAAAPRLYSGTNEHEHAMLREQFLAESGGVELATAQSCADAVEAVAELVDFGQVIAEEVAGITRSHPMAEQARQVAEGKLPATDDDLVTVVEAN